MREPVDTARRKDFHKPDPASELQMSAGRVPPADVDAEAAVLSACLLSADLFDSIQEILRADHFYDPRHRKVFEAVAELSAAEIGRAHV